MDEDDLVAYRQHTINTTAGRKRPASPPLRATTNEFDMDEDEPSIPIKQRVSQSKRQDINSIISLQMTTTMGDTTYTVLSQQSLVGLQHNEDMMTEDEDEEN